MLCEVYCDGLVDPGILVVLMSVCCTLCIQDPSQGAPGPFHCPSNCLMATNLGFFFLPRF